MSVQPTIDFPVRKRATAGRRKIVTDVDEKENSPTKKMQIEKPTTRRSTRTRKMADSSKMDLESIITTLDLTNDDTKKTSRSKERPKTTLVALSTNQESTPSPTNHVASTKSPTTHVELTAPPTNHVALTAPPTNHVTPTTSPTNHVAPTTSPTNQVSTPQVNYKKTKQVLHTSIPDLLVGRKTETDEINDFVLELVTSSRPGSIYVSGAPGTGKTAVLMKIIEGIEQPCIKIVINCMTHKNSQSIFTAIRLGLSEADKKSGSKNTSSKRAVTDIEEYITTSKVPVIMIFDEIDSLDSRNQEVLYTIFEWPTLENSKLVLVGVANSLDLTDRILPRLLSREKCKPRLLNFPPYSRDEIVKIIWERLEKLGPESAFDKPCIMLCASKISSMSGDLRKALDVCRRAVDMVEMEEKKNGGSADPTQKPKKVGLPLIQKVINEVYGQKVVVKNESQLKIPLQQMLAICTLLLMGKMARASKEVNFAKFHENYVRMCKKNGVTEIERSEFLSLCLSIEDQGIINIKKAKEVRLYKTSLRINEKDLESSIHDRALFSTILSKGLD